ncbi:MAG TPA: D-alanyl-D-alanine carboxypeptidase/D-alanyl-D-alanine-endopeptidase [Armatimonadota bacterium]|jgi:D-alanyl-D-alanine carboxypeptidase/D-alanyl-D-alanine-endopeptidase (penicillin-binding protein 4)
MHSFRTVRFALAALMLAAGVSLARADDAAIKAAIDKQLSDPAMARGWTGVLVKSLDNHRVIYALNEDRLFIPASNMKLLVSSACTDVLPKDFRYTTPVLRDGSLDGGTLNGSLYLKGSGDSTLEAKDLVELAKAVKAAGISKVNGDIVGDGSCFDSQRLGYSWGWDDLAAYYSAEIDGLTVDRGTVHVAVTAGDIGAPPVVTMNPDAGYMLVRNTATTVADSTPETMVVDRPMASNVVSVFGNMHRSIAGSVGKGPKVQNVDITMEEPAVYTAYLFRKCLRDEGVTVTGAARGGIAPEGATKVASHDSQPLPEILKLLNKPSDNLMAESLLKTLGLVKNGAGTTGAGATVERDYLKKIGVGADSVLIEDGSGLSRLDLVTPKALASVLEYMWSHPNRDAFIDSLPIAGVDGSLRNRLKGTAAANNVKAKTGYVGKARNLTGYVSTRDGEPLVFVLLMNHYNGDTSPINSVQDRICEILANSSR